MSKHPTLPSYSDKIGVMVGVTQLRPALIASGILILLYSAANLRINHIGGDRASKSRFCRAWLCPAEFTPSRIYELHAESMSTNSVAAVSEFRRALEQDPASAIRWAEFAEALPVNAPASPAGYCMERAVDAGPHSASILVRAGNFFLLRGDTKRAITYFRQILASPEFSDYYSAIFLAIHRMQTPLAEMLADVVPAQASAAQAFLRFEMQTAQPNETQIVWEWLRTRNLADPPMVDEYLDFLLAHEKQEAAANLWADLNRNQDSGYRRVNWIYNSRFESAPDSGKFNWNIDSESRRLAAIIPGVSFSGKSALEVRFSGDENLDFRGVHQRVVLNPGKWRLSVHMKTDGLTTDKGVGVRLFDLQQSSRLDIQTEALTGTNDWTKLEKTFEVTGTSALAQIEVFREASSRFDNKIMGTAWIDEAKLAPLR